MTRALLQALWPVILVLIGIVSIAGMVGATANQATDIAGQYGCTGEGPDGKPYEVDLAIEKRNDVYGLTWSANGETTGIGIGFVKGDTVSAIFQTAQAVGVIQYTVSKHKLDGTWTVPQLDGMLLPEVCSVGSGPAKAV
jgi:hypothetical protein